MSLRALWLAAATLGAVAPGCTVSLPFNQLSNGIPKPFLEYDLDEGTGTTVNDTAGGHTGAIAFETKAPAWSAGHHKNGLTFENDGWINVPQLSGAGFPRHGMLAQWVFVRTLPQGADGAADLFTADDNTAATEEAASPISVYLNNAGQLFMLHGRPPAVVTTAGPVVPTNQWVLIALGWDITQNRLLLYMRPETGAAQSVGGPFADLGATTLDFDVSMRNGTLDEVRWFERLLSDAELAALP